MGSGEVSHQMSRLHRVTDPRVQLGFGGKVKAVFGHGSFEDALEAHRAVLHPSPHSCGQFLPAFPPSFPFSRSGQGSKGFGFRLDRVSLP